MSVYRTFTFIVSCVGAWMGIAAMFWAKAIGRPDYVLVFFGNALLCAMGAGVHWYLSYRLTPKKTERRKTP